MSTLKPHIDYASVVLDGCDDVLTRRLNSLHRRAVKLIFPHITLATDQILFLKMKIMSLHLQVEYSKGLFMYKVLNNEAPEYISNLYTCSPLCYSSSRNYRLSLPRPTIDTSKTIMAFSDAFLWNSYLSLTTRSCNSLSSFKQFNSCTS